jgi:hypothetical protein
MGQFVSLGGWANPFWCVPCISKSVRVSLISTSVFCGGIRVQLKVRIFHWQLSKKRLPSNDNIRKRRSPSNGCCALCGEVEDNNQIFFLCPLAKFMWSAVRELLHCSWNPSCCTDIFRILHVHVGQTRRVFWLACTALLWTLWNLRNKFTIEGVFPAQCTDGLYKMTMYL